MTSPITTVATRSWTSLTKLPKSRPRTFAVTVIRLCPHSRVIVDGPSTTYQGDRRTENYLPEGRGTFQMRFAASYCTWNMPATLVYSNLPVAKEPRFIAPSALAAFSCFKASQ